MNENTLYFFDLNNELKETNINYQKIHKMSCDVFFQEMCYQDITTLKGRIDAIKKIFSFAYNIPIYLNNKMIFFKINDDRMIWINAINVIDIFKKENNTIIVFRNGHSLEVNKNYRNIRKSYLKAKEIIDYKNGFIL